MSSTFSSRPVRLRILIALLDGSLESIVDASSILILEEQDRNRGDQLEFVKNFTHAKNFQLYFFLGYSGWLLIDLTQVLGMWKRVLE